MRVALICLVIGGMGCANVPVRRATMGTALLSLACDWGQTRSAAAGHWATTREANMILGEAPGTRSVDLYFLASAAAMVGVVELLPAGVRPFVYGSVAAVQVRTITGNFETTQGVCGIH